MVPIVFAILMRAMAGEEVPCKHCIFAPWPSLLAVYLSCFLVRRIEQTCAGMIRIGVHAAAVAGLFSYNPSLAFACSLHSALHVLPALGGDEVTICLLSAYGVCLVGLAARFCSFAVSTELQIQALLWPIAVDVLFAVLLRLLWGEPR
jgi:hypothetical protein